MKVVLQDGIKDCGICCLLSIIRFFGGDVSKEYLRKITNTNKDGVSAYNLIEAAKEIGFDSYGAEGDLNKIDHNNLPCIAHVHVNKNYQHFVVLYKIEKNKVSIMDPAKGKRIISKSEFLLMTSGKYIFLTPKKKLPIIKNQNLLLKQILTYLRNNIIFIFSFTSALLFIEILISFYFKYVLTYGINYSIVNNIPTIALYIFLLTVLLFFIHILYDRYLYKMLFRFDEKVTFLTFQQLLLLPYFYYKNRTTGEVLSRFHDLNTIKRFLVSFLNYFLSDLFRIILFFFLLFHYSKLLSLCYLCYFLFFFCYTLLRRKKKKRDYKYIRRVEDSIETSMIESISNVDTTKGSHLEKRFYDKFLLKYRHLLEKNYSYYCSLSLDSNLQLFAYHSLTIVVITIGAYLVIDEKMSLSTLIIYQTFFSYLLNSTSRFFQIFEQLSDFSVCFQRVNDLFTIEKENFSKSYYYLKYDCAGDIKFSNVTYSINNKLIIDSLSLTIKNKEKIFLYGKSGCGKSTLMKMLLRYIDVPFGNISINGIDINHYHLENIRKYITYVSSNEMLYYDSIYQNICLYQEVTEDDFMNVVKITRVNSIFGDDFSSYQVMLEENGFLFSSGERQRIILARSLLRKSSIYIFDEAFGQIDIELSNQILKDMMDYLKDKTVILISHRKNNKKHFQRILKLEKGKIYES